MHCVRTSYCVEVDKVFKIRDLPLHPPGCHGALVEQLLRSGHGHRPGTDQCVHCKSY